MNIVLNIPADGPIILSLESLQQAGFAPGDQVVLSMTTPGHLYLHKAETLPECDDLKSCLEQLIREAFPPEKFYDRTQVVAFLREVRREVADER